MDNLGFPYGIIGRSLGRMPSGRVIIEDSEGMHTELSATRPLDPSDPNAGWINFPTIFGGQRLSEDDAYEIVVQNGFVDPETGRRLETFASQDEAVAAAIARSQSLGPQLNAVLRRTPRTLRKE
jgi:hypothetical protein